MFKSLELLKTQNQDTNQTIDVHRVFIYIFCIKTSIKIKKSEEFLNLQEISQKQLLVKQRVFYNNEMLNQNKFQNSISSPYFDQISQIQVKNVQLDFQVARLFSEYQMPPKKTKLKTYDTIKNKNQPQKTSQNSVSTKQRSNNQEDISNLEKHSPNPSKQGNLNSLKKNISKKVLFVNNQQKGKFAQTTVKKTARKKTVFSEFERTGDAEKKHLKVPEAVKICRKVSKTKQIQEKCKIGAQNKKFQHEVKQQQQTRNLRQSCGSNNNSSALKKSRSERVMSGSRQRISSKVVAVAKIEKVREDNRKIIMRDYFGEDEEETKKKIKNGNALDVKNKRSISGQSMDIMVSRQRVESKSRPIMTAKSRERVGSKSKERILVYSSKNR